jgi:protein-arginine kinase activator protein McsA
MTKQTEKYKIDEEYSIKQYVCDRCTASYDYEKDMCENCHYTSFSIMQVKVFIKDKLHVCEDCSHQVGKAYVDEESECNCGGEYEFLGLITGEQQ